MSGMHLTRQTVYDSAGRRGVLSASIVIRLDTLLNHTESITIVHVAREILGDIRCMEQFQPFNLRNTPEFCIFVCRIH